jgi:hypothetical protein
VCSACTYYIRITKIYHLKSTGKTLQKTNYMMAIKVVFEVLVLPLVFAMFTTHEAWGEQDCYG